MTTVVHNRHANAGRHIKAVFFDLGGVIIGGPPTNTFKAMLHACKRWIPANDQLINAYLHDACKGACTSRQVVQRIVRAYGLPPAARAKLTHLLSEQWYIKHARVNRQVLRLAAMLAARYTVGIISDTIPVHTRANRRLGIFKGFNSIALSHNVHAHKPDAAIFRYALKKAGVTARQALFIDDRADKLVGASRLGMHAILFTNAKVLIKDLKRIRVL